MSISLQQAFAQLRSMVSNPTLNQLIKEMIVVGQDKNSDLHSFYQICTNWISTPGFRPGSKAPLPMLLKGCMESLVNKLHPSFTFCCFFQAIRSLFEKFNALLQPISRKTLGATGEHGRLC